MRTQQFIRSRIVWRSTCRADGARSPPSSRINGKYFCYVVEKDRQGGLVARQRPIEVGELIGNDYVVQERPRRRRSADRVGHPEDRRRRAGEDPNNVRRYIHSPSDPGLRLLARSSSSAGADRHPDDAGGAVSVAWRRRWSTSPRSIPAPTRRKSRPRSRRRSSRPSTASRACST